MAKRKCELQRKARCTDGGLVVSEKKVMVEGGEQEDELAGGEKAS